MREPSRTDGREDIGRRHRIHTLGPTRGEERAKRRQPLLAVLHILERRDEFRVIPPCRGREGRNGRALPLRQGITLPPRHLPQSLRLVPRLRETDETNAPQSDISASPLHERAQQPALRATGLHK